MEGKVETRVGFFVLAALVVFAYMGFQIGAFRFDRGKYTRYVLYFKDISGLSRKADVKIAGVKVGWVEEVELSAENGMRARAGVTIANQYKLYGDAHAIVRQDGLLGPHYVEVIPGDPLLHELADGDALARPSVAPVSVDELMHQFKKIAANVEDVTQSVRLALGGAEGREQLRLFFDNLQVTAEKISSVSDVLERTFARNEENVDRLLAVGNTVDKLADQLEHTVFPAFQEGVEKISNSFDRDFDRIATKFESTAEALEQASVQARDGLRSVNSVAEKIDEGKGLVGKLVNEEETYQDLKTAILGFKNYVTKLDRLQFIFDAHFESMHRPAENYEFQDGKGYFDIRIHPNEDHFYLVQFATSEKGYVERKNLEKHYFSQDDRLINPLNIVPQTGMPQLFVEPSDIFIEHRERYKRNTIKLGLQFGKIYKNVALRFGLFEGSAGLGVDCEIPFDSEKFRWVTSFELFDMRGWNRKNDKRPHMKWLNRMFIMRNIYFTFGADDFVSKHNASAFMGAGVRFGDDNVKYLFSSISAAGGAGSSLG